MEVRELHPWDVSPREARRIQDELRSRIDLSDRVRLEDIRCVAGIDNSYRKHESGATAYAVVVSLSFPALEIVDTAYGSAPVTFPYVPGLLTFREAPAVVAACRAATAEPDVVLCDGQGIAHFRRLGLATHFGLLLGRPTIGCAKSRLTGDYQEPPREFGASSPLIDRGEVVGAAVRTRPSHAPLFVSPGNGVSIETAVQIALAMCRDNRFLPEPTRLAHELVTQYARGASPT